jgi:hypothetical protein
MKAGAGVAKALVEGYVKTSQSVAKEAESNALDASAVRVEGEIKARKAALIEAVRARTVQLLDESKTCHQYLPLC